MTTNFIVRALHDCRLLGTELELIKDCEYFAIEAKNQPDYKAKGLFFVYPDCDKDDCILCSVADKEIEIVSEDRENEAILWLANSYFRSDLDLTVRIECATAITHAVMTYSTPEHLVNYFLKRKWLHPWDHTFIWTKEKDEQLAEWSARNEQDENHN